MQTEYDCTLERDFIEQNADRLLAWEFVHGLYCGGKTLRPCRLAERIGLSTEEVQEIIKKATRNTGYDIIKNGRR